MAFSLSLFRAVSSCHGFFGSTAFNSFPVTQQLNFPLAKNKRNKKWQRKHLCQDILWQIHWLCNDFFQNFHKYFFSYFLMWWQSWLHPGLSLLSKVNHHSYTSHRNSSDCALREPMSLPSLKSNGSNSLHGCVLWCEIPSFRASCSDTHQVSDAQKSI